MSVEFDRGSPVKFDSRTLSRETLNRWTGRTPHSPAAFSKGLSLSPWMLLETSDGLPVIISNDVYIYIYMYICVYIYIYIYYDI